MCLAHVCVSSLCEILSGCGLFSAAGLFYRSMSVLYFNVSSLRLWTFFLDLCAVEMFRWAFFPSFWVLSAGCVSSCKSSVPSFFSSSIFVPLWGSRSLCFLSTFFFLALLNAVQIHSNFFFFFLTRSLFLLLFSLLHRNLAATSATLTRSSPRWRWS